MDTAAADRDDAPMTTPRRLLVDPVNACDYHLVSRCVQGAFLCGRDPRTGRDCSHRRQWLVDRIRLLACCFAVEVYAYCIMSNHFHLVARYDPLACWRWSDAEVARRWVDAFPPTEKGEVLEERKPEARELLLGNPGRLFRARCTLGSLSDFMKHLKQPIARRANEGARLGTHAFGVLQRVGLDWDTRVRRPTTRRTSRTRRFPRTAATPGRCRTTTRDAVHRHGQNGPRWDS